VVVREALGVVSCRVSLLPDNFGDEVVRPELLIEDNSHAVNFGVVEMNPHRCVRSEQRLDIPDPIAHHR
jgi:hypothetical protein